MATFYPNFDQIKASQEQPSSGEMFLLRALDKILDDRFEVFFKPFLNGDSLDIVVMRRNRGVLIFEVKDWDLNDYVTSDSKIWTSKKNNLRVKSPYHQVLRYKRNMYELHVPGLHERKLLEFGYWNIVRCAVFFSNFPSKEIFLFSNNKVPSSVPTISIGGDEVYALGGKDFSSEHLKEILEKTYLLIDNSSRYFDERLYLFFKRLLNPTTSQLSQGIRIVLNDEQIKNASSAPGESKMKGVAGSGKTTVIAQRAINSNLRTGKRVLILCFNITLKNFIQLRIKDLATNYNESDYYIEHYHQFIKNELNNLGIPIEGPKDSLTGKNISDYFEQQYFSNLQLFENIKDDLEKYEVIIIDEVQDYRKPWLQIVKQYFLKPSGEYFLVGDAKQNIYDNELTGREFSTNIRGDFRRLKKCWRSDPLLISIIDSFQSKFLSTKYEHDEIENRQNTELFKKQYGNLDYVDFQSFAMNKIFEYVTNQSSIFNQQPEDIVILGLRIDKLRNLEAYFRYKTGQQVTSMFESLEQYLKLLLGLSLKVCKNIIPEQEELLNLYYNLSEKERNNLVELLSVRIFFEYDHDDRFVRLFKELKADSSIVLTNKLEVFIRYLLQENKILENHIVRTHLENELKILRNNKKIHFQFNTGCMKISTIHSFKGWEAKNIFVIIEEKFSDSGFLNTFNELIYTALTRAKLNVFFINTGNSQFSELNSLLTNKEK